MKEIDELTVDRKQMQDQRGRGSGHKRRQGEPEERMEAAAAKMPLGRGMKGHVLSRIPQRGRVQVFYRPGDTILGVSAAEQCTI